VTLPGFEHLEPRRGSVTLRGKKMEIVPATMRQCLVIANRFPEVQRLVLAAQGTAPGIMAIFLSVPDEAVHAFIATVWGKHGDEDAEKAASYLDFNEVLNVLKEAGRAMFGETGFLPFVDTLAAMLGDGDPQPQPRSRLSASPSPKPRSSSTRKATRTR